MENIGDIDGDGINDIAVSAPFQEEGVVYVYRGSPSGLIATQPQVCTVVSRKTNSIHTHTHKQISPFRCWPMN